MKTRVTTRTGVLRNINGVLHKWCHNCHHYYPLGKFYKGKCGRDGKQGECKNCRKIRLTNWRHKTNRQQPREQLKTCSSYLGVHVAEKLVSGLFTDVRGTSYGNRGFDFVCNDGTIIDVKSSCLLHTNGSKFRHWQFSTKRNTTPDYFVCLAFDTRDNLSLLHLWVIPESVVSGKSGLSISESELSLKKWLPYEKPIGNISVGELCKVVA